MEFHHAAAHSGSPGSVVVRPESYGKVTARVAFTLRRALQQVRTVYCIRTCALKIALQCILAVPVLMVPVLSAQSSATGVLKLTVEDVITHYALSANISLEGPQQLSVQANRAGRVSVKLQPGEYRVEVSAFGHKIARTHYKVRPGANLPFTIMLDPQIPPAEERPGTISAEIRPGFTLLHGYTVDSETGQPLSGVTVRVVQDDVRAQTDSVGHYDLLVPTPVPEYPGGAGTATLTFKKPGYKEIVLENFVIAGKAMGGVALDMERGSGAIEHDATHKMMMRGGREEEPQSAMPALSIQRCP